MIEPRADRPWMPGYQNPGAAPDTSGWSKARRLLSQARGYWISSTRPDGRPHVMPVWGVLVDDTVWFSTSRTSRKGRNLAADPRVAVHLDDTDDVIIIEGTVEEVAGEDPGMAKYVDAYEAKYGIRPGPSSDRDVVYRVKPLQAFTWKESDFADRATRWRF